MRQLIKQNKLEAILLLLIILVASFLRFWKIGVWQHFTYDQARDYLIVKRMIVDYKFTLVGPTVLIPGVFLPPFYYYSLAPFLWLFKFHLIGPDIYTALLGTGAIIVFYILAKDLFGKIPALLTTFLFAFNPYLIQTSRHAWNPNTIFLFTLLFGLAFERYLFKQKHQHLILAAFALSWSLNLHYAVLVFVPLLIFLFCTDLKKHRLSKHFLISIIIFLFFTLPIFIFDLRHNFPNFRGILSFLNNQKGSQSLITNTNLIPKTFLGLVDTVKMPVVLLSGVSQGQNLTINPSHILLWDKVSPFIAADSFGKIKLVIFFLIWLASLGAILHKLYRSKEKRVVMLVLFLFFGFLIREIFPPSSFYFYHYTFLYPFVFLAIASLFHDLLKKKILPSESILFLGVVSLALLTLLPEGIKSQVKDENFFLPACRLIAQDYNLNKGKYAIAANVADDSRWDHNGLEYRYFLESFFGLPSSNWDVADYQQAEVLYLVDEGKLSDPLALKGMEMDSFGSAEVEQTWRLKNGSKIHKLIKN